MILNALLIHGAGAGGWEWNLWREVLHARGLDTLAPDLQPGPNGLAATTLDDYREQTRASLAAMPRPRAAIGASLGGLLAWLCGDLADAMILINPLRPKPWAELPSRDDLTSPPPSRDWPEIIPWHRHARLTSTRRAMPDADEAAAIYAQRRWRDESGAVLRSALAGVEAPMPTCPILCIATQGDEDVDPQLTAQFASAIGATLILAPGSHVGPVLGRDAARLAAQAADWLSAR